MNSLAYSVCLKISSISSTEQHRALLFGVFLSITVPASASSPSPPETPFVPTDPHQILETLPLAATDPTIRELRELRRQLSDQPDDLELAIQVARRNIAIGRSQADPRYYGYAQAALAPWAQQASPPPDILLLRAILRQNRHDFSGALTDLQHVLAAKPHHAQAWLTQAVIQQVLGEPLSAARSCMALRRLVSPLLFTACLSGALGRGGHIESAYDNLQRALAISADADAEERLYALTVLAELAEQRGDASAADQHFRAALNLGQRSVYLLGAYADFLLDQNRPAEVRSLLQDEQRADNLLLRLTLAERRLNIPTWRSHAETLEARFAAARQRGDGVHITNEARFRLELRQQPQEALTLAQQNWAQQQREPQDARLLLEAALAAHQPIAARDVLDWLNRIKLEDARLTDLSQRLREIGS